jgi:hypothetical protein
MCRRLSVKWWNRFCYTAAVGLGVLVASPLEAVQLAYEPFTIGVGPGEYHVGPLPGQPNFSIGPQEPESFFSGPWAGSAGTTGQVVQETSLVPGSPGGSVTASGDGRAGRYLSTPWDHA